MSDCAIVCPHCFSTGVHSLCLIPGPMQSIESTRLLCENCYKKFRVYFKEGEISGVKKS
jgi:hypothetical protein